MGQLQHHRFVGSLFAAKRDVQGPWRAGFLRFKQWVRVDAYLFDVHYDAGRWSIRFIPDSGDLDSVQEFVDGFAETLGRMPRALLSDLREVELMDGVDYAGGNGDQRIIHWGRDAEDPWVERDGWLEELLFHEGVHAVLDRKYLSSPGWIAAREADGAFISDYARDYPDREDLAETLLMCSACATVPSG